MTRELFHRNASQAILAGIFLLIFFSIPITNILVILYVLNWLAGNSLKTWSWQKRDWLVLLIISPWILELVSVLYSTDMVNGLHQVVKRYDWNSQQSYSLLNLMESIYHISAVKDTN